MKVLKIYCEQKLTNEQLQEIKESIGVDTDEELLGAIKLILNSQIEDENNSKMQITLESFSEYLN